MYYEIVHDRPGRIRFRCGKWLFTENEANGVVAQLKAVEGVFEVRYREANGGFLVLFEGNVRNQVIAAMDALDVLHLPTAAPDPATSAEALDNRFQLQIAKLFIRRTARRFLLPAPVRAVLCVLRALRFGKEGLRALAHGRLSVEVLDMTAIWMSVFQRDFNTAGLVMFLLKVSDVLTDYTRARSNLALRQNLAICAETVWVESADGIEVEVPVEEVAVGDHVRVRAGSLVPFDGTVMQGEGEVNEASMTGESALVHKDEGSTVFAGTAMDEGSLLIRVDAQVGDSRLDGIVELVENSSDRKALVQSRAERLADGVVPISLGLFLAKWALTRNLASAMSVLMVDYSCAIKLSTPVAVMSAMREATKREVVVKGGKYLEALAQADTIVFDKTGTLTNACPEVVDVIGFNGWEEDEILRTAACLEEHFPHSMARAIVRCAEERGLLHSEENHAEVEYIVAHGIVTSIDGKKACVGSAHFVFEDEGVPCPEGLFERINREAPTASTVFLAVDGELCGAMCISDPLRPEAKEVVAALRARGFDHVVMLTGDSENCARTIGHKLGLDEWHSQVLPEDKAAYVEDLKRRGHTVLMVGDGINDSPALAAADVSIALSDASDIARNVADISVLTSSLTALLTMRDIAVQLMKRVNNSYGFIVSFNTALIILGFIGILPANLGAILHNGSTAAIVAHNMRPLLPEASA
ncbi:MAG: heavy metal translocating P-type ATPase [Coriobacteriia bacterium]|nr:heavy metal translocating P-type ATPase [Coriobacteriia bacterium]